MSGKDTYCGHETPAEWALEGLPLASFKQRAAAYAIDLILIGVVCAALLAIYVGWQVAHGVHNVSLAGDTDEIEYIAAIAPYHSLFNYFGNGLTPGKRALGIRVVSLVGPRLGRWQSVERALGYGAAMLEGGLGFAQYFWSPNRMCAQDRLAETIVVVTRKGT